MSRILLRHSALFAWTACALSIALAGGGTVILFLSTPIPLEQRTGDLLYLLNALVITLIGAFVAAHRPRHPISWLMLVAGVALSVQGFTQFSVVHALAVSPARPASAPLLAWLASWCWLVPYICLKLLLFLFPSGRWLSHRWRSIAMLAIVYDAFLFTISAFSTPLQFDAGPEAVVEVANPLGFLPPPQTYATWVPLPFFILLGLGVVCLVHRFLRARGAERQQLKWVTYAVAVALLLLVLLQNIPGSRMLINLVLLAIPLAIALSILRYRLYDIDLIIRRTLIYAILTTVLATAYFGSVVMLQRLFQALTGQAQSEMVTVFSTLAIAALFQPLRRRIQAFIDRRFYRRQYDAALALSAFAVTVRHEVELAALTEGLLTVIQETLHPSHLSLWMLGGEEREG